jgi:hypothetical protein
MRRAEGQWSEPFATAVVFMPPTDASIAGSPFALYGVLNDGAEVDLRRIESFPHPGGFAPGDLLRGCLLPGLEHFVIERTSDKVHIAFEDCDRIHYRRAANGAFNVGDAVLGPLEFDGTALQGQMVDLEADVDDHFIVYSTLPPNQEVMLYTRRYPRGGLRGFLGL